MMVTVKFTKKNYFTPYSASNCAICSKRNTFLLIIKRRKEDTTCFFLLDIIAVKVRDKQIDERFLSLASMIALSSSRVCENVKNLGNRKPVLVMLVWSTSFKRESIDMSNR